TGSWGKPPYSDWFFSDFNHTGKAFPFSIPSRYQFTQNILHSQKKGQFELPGTKIYKNFTKD
ncbi:hypothetical protein, partial [Limosilactobacillus fermentum]|uniref:hypothetical protein n=1 Tax=Limosilactobacillus fermentum TaxID=1613 RepID=UPI0023E42607